MSVPKIPTKRLKPCSCGGEAVVCEYPVGVRELWNSKKENVIYKYYAECRKCGEHTKEYISKRKAIEVWNRRARRDKEK